jgi:hypothetical protein
LEDKRYEIHRERTGAAHENEDVWTLVYDIRNGVWIVEHTWRYANPVSGQITSKGKGRQSIETFERTPEGKRLEGRLGAALRKASNDA